MLSGVGGEHVLGPIDIVAEADIIYFFHISFVEVLARYQLGEGRTVREQVQLLEHAEELILSDVRAPGPVEVLERRFKHNSVSNDVESDFLQSSHKRVLLCLREDGVGLGILNDAALIRTLLEHRLDIAAELCVTDKACA